MRYACFVVLFTGLYGRAFAAAEPGHTATVRLIIVDGAGRKLTRYKLDRFQGSSGVDYSQKFVQGAATEIPYGEYEVRVDAARDWTVKRVRVVFPVVNVLLAVHYSIEPTRHEVKRTDGKAVNLPPTRGSAYLVIFPVGDLISGHRQVVQLGPDGSFTLFNSSLGLHVAVLMDDRGFVGAKPFSTTTANQPFTLDFR